ncbi:MAG TPA: S1 RNA-binding domain-containing protein [Thermoanaerobaculia bacterium]|nr:S1 RNA-binding domain-containing protein [Thermoanaerobaculia bacterium]
MTRNDLPLPEEDSTAAGTAAEAEAGVENTSSADASPTPEDASPAPEVEPQAAPGDEQPADAAPAEKPLAGDAAEPAALAASDSEAADTTAGPTAAPPLVPEPPAEPPSPQVEALMRAQSEGTQVTGKVIGWNKGGFHVVVDGVPAFCPKSQIELGNPKRAAVYIDQEYPFRVLEVREGGKRVVVSRREILEEDRRATLENLRRIKNSGEVIDGTVTSIVDFGAFVEIGGLEGLVHLSQLSRRRVESARELLQVGQPVQVKVIKIEKGGERISLSMKALEKDPWEDVAERWSAGDRFEGRLLRRAEFGLFVEMSDGIEGLLHASQVPHGKDLDDETLQPGQTVEGWVREVDPVRRRLSLSMREVAKGDPWKEVRTKYQDGEVVAGEVEQIAKFGIFVQLEPGLTGLLPFSALGLPEGANVRRQYRTGQRLEVVVDSIDTKRRRVSLAPVGAKLEGTKADLKDYQRKLETKDSGGLGAMAAALGKIRPQA